ncbi:zinc finger, CCHC-type containing protein [Tanacetum coccineum]
MTDFAPGQAVIDAAQRKRGKYLDKCAAIGYGFLPFSFSSLGELEANAVTLLKRISKFSMIQDIGARAAIHIFNRISFAIAKGVEAQIVVYVLTTPMPELLEDDTVEAIRRRAKWENDEYICRGHILNEDASSKKFLVSNFNNYKMVDSRPVMEQFNELLRILGQYTQHGLKMDESISVSSVIDKLPPFGKDFKHTLKHDRCWFKTYEPVEDGSILYMGDDHFAHVHGKGSVVLELSSGKSITLFNVFYVSKLRKNLISGPVLNKCGYKQVYESDKYILSKSGVFIGFGYYNNGMFMLNLNKVPDDSGSVYMLSSTVVNSSFCYVYLLHAKDEDHDKFRIYKTEVELKQNDLIKTLRIDRGGEYYDLVFFQSVGIIHETTAPYTPQQNGVAERKNKALKEMVNSMAVVRLPDLKRKTLGEKGIDCIFVGYAEHSKAYRFYVIEPNDSVFINIIIELRDAIFYENCFSSIPRSKNIIPNSDESQGMIIQMMYQKEEIDDENGSIMENNTWVLSDLPPGSKPFGCKWIFKRKMKVDGTIDKFKARLVIQGFRQKEGIYYFDTYAPAALITTIRLLLALAAIHNLVIHQMDVKTAFLNSDLEKEVYMKQPEGFVMPGNEHKVCKLVKKFDGSSKGVIICLYVDDMLIFGTDQNQVDKTKKFLSSMFSMKDMREADVILGIKIKRENKGIVITQSYYIEKILKKFNREDCSPVSTPMDPVEKLKPNTGKPVDQLEYSRDIVCLMYAMTSTRLDITYAVGRLSRFTSNHSRQHWHAITKVFKYLKGTMNYGLSYVGYPSVLEAYSDASWINHVEDSYSSSGWVFLLVAWGGVHCFHGFRELTNHASMFYY